MRLRELLGLSLEELTALAETGQARAALREQWAGTSTDDERAAIILAVDPARRAAARARSGSRRQKLDEFAAELTAKLQRLRDGAAEAAEAGEPVSVYDIPLTTLAGGAARAGRAARPRSAHRERRVALRAHPSVRGVAARCTTGTAIAVWSSFGVPCDQFANQEPGSADEIAEFCSAEYNGDVPPDGEALRERADRHPLFRPHRVVRTPAARPATCEWNFEKFLVSPRGEPVARFRPDDSSRRTSR